MIDEPIIDLSHLQPCLIHHPLLLIFLYKIFENKKKHRHRETRIFIHSYIYGSTYPNSITLYLYNSITSSIMNHYFCKFMQWSMAFLYIIIMIINQLSPQDHPNFLSQSWLGGARHNHIFYFRLLNIYMDDLQWWVSSTHWANHYMN